MDKIKAGRPTIDFLRLCYVSGRPPMLWGQHGLGKSELFEQAATEMNIGFLSRDLSLMEPPDLVGLPQCGGDTTRYLPPAFLPRAGRGILVFEEINRCERFMRAPCLQLMTTRTLNDYRLPEGWLPAAAVNPIDENYEVFDLDPALVSRFVQVTLRADQQEWLVWAQQSDVHSAVLNYVRGDPTVFDAPESNPRAWTYVSDVLKSADGCGSHEGLLRSAIIGLVGDKRGSAFLSTLKERLGPLTSDEILSSYLHHQSVCRTWINTGKLDLVESSLLNVKKHLQPRADYEAVHTNRSQWRNLAVFLYDLPGDLHEHAKEYFHERDYAFPRRPRTGGGNG